MTVRQFGFIALAVMALVAPASATQHAAGIIVNDPVEAERQIIAKDCTELVLDDGFAQRIELTGDGRDDVVMNYGALECDGMVSAFCGSGGCSYTIYVAREDGRYIRAFEGLIYGVQGIYYEGGRAISIGRHGSACGRPGYQGCQEARRWNGSAFEIVASDHDGVDRRWVVEGSGAATAARVTAYDGAALGLSCETGEAVLRYAGNWYDPAGISDGATATLRLDLFSGSDEIGLPMRWLASATAWVSTDPVPFDAPLIAGMAAGEAMAVTSEDGLSTNRFPLAGSSRAITALRQGCASG